MPCYLFTLHGYRTWMPARAEGFVRRRKGIQKQNARLANHYRDIATDDLVCFRDQEQLAMIRSILQSSKHQQFRCHFIATESTHVHYLISWRTIKTWQTLRQSTKERMTRALNPRTRRTWFSRNGSRRRVQTRQHFDYLVNEYLPRHRGWKWSEGRRFFE